MATKTATVSQPETPEARDEGPDRTGSDQRALNGIVRQMTRLQWIYVIVGLVVVAAMVLPSLLGGGGPAV